MHCLRSLIERIARAINVLQSCCMYINHCKMNQSHESSILVIEDFLIHSSLDLQSSDDLYGRSMHTHCLHELERVIVSHMSKVIQRA